MSFSHRRMFPSVRVKVRNLDPCQQYYIAMDVMPVDSKRYRCEIKIKWRKTSRFSCCFTHPHTHAPLPRRYVYHSSQWMVAGNTDHSCISPRLYVHPDSPCAGEMWMRQVISFDRVKLTNNEMDDKGHVGNTQPVLYTPLTWPSQPCTHIFRRRSRQQRSWSGWRAALVCCRTIFV